MKKVLICLLGVIFSFQLLSCKGSCTNTTSKYDVVRTYYYDYLDTISYVLVEYKKDEMTKTEVENDLAKVKDILLQIEKEFSSEQTMWMEINQIEKSTLMKINENSGKKDSNGNPLVTEVSDAFLYVLKQAIDIAEKTSGGLDPSIGPLSSLWDIPGKVQYCSLLDYDEERCVIPSEKEIILAKALVDYRKIEIDEVNKTVYLPIENMKLDLGAIAKGYAADCVLESLKKDAYTYISVNLGGNVISFGEAYTADQDHTTSSIVPTGIENPFYDKFQNQIIMNVYEKNVTVVASGISKRYIEVWDESTNTYKKYHHILNSKTGYPFDNEIETVTIIGASSLLADGISTGIFAKGLEDGIKMIQELEDYQAIFITKDYKIYIVGDFHYQLEPNLENVYTVIKK